jgi:hypothetical protein
LEKGWRRKGKNKSRASKKVNRIAVTNFGRSRGSTKCRLEFPQGMARNGTPSRADATSFLGLPRKRIVSSKLGISHNGHSPALCWLSCIVRGPEGNVDWLRPTCGVFPRHSSPPRYVHELSSQNPHGRRDSTLMESRCPILPGPSRSFAASFRVPHKNARPCCHERARARRFLSCSIGNSTCRRRSRCSPRCTAR